MLVAPAPALAADGTDASAATIATSDTTASTDFEGKAATEVLASLKTKGRAPKTGYARTQFGAAWADVDHNGCDTRNDILKRDMTDVTFKAGTHDCIVTSGTLADPYTGKTISFKRGNKTSSAVQIDHVVALSDAWQKGAQKLSASQRKQLANDPYNLLAVDGPSNQQKSDGDAATWLPKNKSFRCAYVARQIGVKAKYSLWVTKAERKAMTKVLDTCPTQTVPLNDEAQATADTEAAEAQRKAAAEEAQRQAEAQAQQQAQQQQQQQDANVYYPNCAAVRAAGKAPLYQGQPGYSTKLDRDRDGVACE
ncbi:GmrSD restriction endonuclease domain-containing protein [Bifidobacterium stellenboschense]|nr:DUF1524 domain-containing protein [Bifidobacterium stellenboschense]